VNEENEMGVTVSSIQADFWFAKECTDDFKHISPLLRYVAAINPDATKKEFIEAAVREGYNPNTASIQFVQSRQFTLGEDDSFSGINKNGSLISGELK
jgi:hypothetical protein